MVVKTAMLFTSVARVTNYEITIPYPPAVRLPLVWVDVRRYDPRAAIK